MTEKTRTLTERLFSDQNIAKRLIGKLRRTIQSTKQLGFRNLLWELSLIFRTTLVNKPETKFIIYGSARTGTTICGSLMSNHKDVIIDHAVSRKDWNNIYKKIGFGYVAPLHFPNIL